ncbi:hypothetical protein AB0O26_05120, partial [Micrococcus luteus]|uniref:hypothetical protein n=1 Tax=Micrococcus luteus TaxID=1270 RepID=UPI0034158C0C
MTVTLRRRVLPTRALWGRFWAVSDADTAHLSIQTENTAKWLDTHDRTGETFRKRQLVIVD